MAHRFIIVDYEKAEDKTPRISGSTGDRREAEKRFQASAERRVRSVVLYDTQTDRVIAIAIDGPPIYLVKAIEKARGELEPNFFVSESAQKTAEKAAGIVIGQIVQALTGVDLVSIFLVPYYLIKGDGAAAVAAVATVAGGILGAKIATEVRGPEWRNVGGMLGGAAAGAATYALVKSQTPPSPKCPQCKGTGLVRDFRRCANCNGKGYRE